MLMHSTYDDYKMKKNDERFARCDKSYAYSIQQTLARRSKYFFFFNFSSYYFLDVSVIRFVVVSRLRRCVWTRRRLKFNQFFHLLLLLLHYSSVHISLLYIFIICHKMLQFGKPYSPEHAGPMESISVASNLSDVGVCVRVFCVCVFRMLDGLFMNSFHCIQATPTTNSEKLNAKGKKMKKKNSR